MLKTFLKLLNSLNIKKSADTHSFKNKGKTMSAYIIFIRKALKDQAEMKIYSSLARKASQNFNVKALAFYGKTIALENITSDGVAILEFENIQTAQDWYQSDSYQKAKEHRDLAAEYIVIITEGLA